MNTESIDYLIRLNSGLYIDNKNRFQPNPIFGVPVYSVPGGDVDITPKTRQALLGHTLAILPSEPGWTTFLREKFHVDEKSLELLGKAVGLVSDVFTVVGWVNAVVNFAKWLGILGSGPTLESLCVDILNKLSTVQRMIAQGQKNVVMITIEGSRADVRTVASEIEKSFEDVYNGDDPTRNRLEDQQSTAQTAVRKLLAEEIGKTFFLLNEYKDVWFFPIFFRTLVTVPGGGVPNQAVRFLGDGDLRFDYRHIVPDVMNAVLTYIRIIIRMAPDFRSTREYRDVLVEFADLLDKLVERMRGCLAKTEFTAAHFSGVNLDQAHPVDPLFATTRQGVLDHSAGWTVGALDLCAHTLGFFQNARAEAAKAGNFFPTKLGNLDGGWKPSNIGLEYVGPRREDGVDKPAYWRITNPQECADQVNQQAEEDYVTLLSTSGFLSLTQLAATVRHLTEDPVTSETVDGKVSRRMTKQDRIEVTVETTPRLGCIQTSFTGLSEIHQCRTTVNITTQRLGRFTNPSLRNRLQLSYGYYLVAFANPIEVDGTGYPLSEVALAPGTSPVTIKQVALFDWYIRLNSQSSFDRVSARIASNLAGMGSPPSRPLVTATAPMLDFGDYSRWGEPDATDWNGEIRNMRFGPVKVTATVTTSDESTKIELENELGEPNVRSLYLAVSETLKSGKIIRTYFDVSMNTKLTFLPKEFFDHEDACRRKEREVLSHFSEVAHVPPGTPNITFGRDFVNEAINNLRLDEKTRIKRLIDKLDG